MKSLKTLIAYGVLVWVLPFIFSIIIFFLHDRERPLFESLISVFGILTVVLFTNFYFKNRNKSLREGILLGFVWVLLSLSFDFLFFIVGPVKMNITEYIKDIGISYLAIPIITVGFSYLPKAKED